MSVMFKCSCVSFFFGSCMYASATLPLFQNHALAIFLITKRTWTKYIPPFFSRHRCFFAAWHHLSSSRMQRWRQLKNSQIHHFKTKPFVKPPSNCCLFLCGFIFCVLHSLRLQACEHGFWSISYSCRIKTTKISQTLQFGFCRLV